MTHSRLPTSRRTWDGALLVTAVMLAACGGRESTAPGGNAAPLFDAAAVTATTDAARTVLEQPVFAAILAQPFGFFPIGRAIAPPVLGVTYVRDASGGFVRDSTRTGAPPNGVRFIIQPWTYGTGASGNPVGWADVVDTTVNGTHTRRVTISDGHATVYTSTRTTGFPTGPTAPVVLTDLTGTASGGGQTITFRSSLTRDTAAAGPVLPGIGGAPLAIGLGGRLTYDVTAAAAGASFATRMSVPLAAGDTTRATFVSGGRTLVLANAAAPYRGLLPANTSMIVGPLYAPGDTTRLTLDGVFAGRIVVQRAADGVTVSGVAYLRADGTPMTAAERAALASLVSAAGSLPLVATLALAVDTWRWEIRAGS